MEGPKNLALLSHELFAHDLGLFYANVSLSHSCQNSAVCLPVRVICESSSCRNSKSRHRREGPHILADEWQNRYTLRSRGCFTCRIVCVFLSLPAWFTYALVSKGACFFISVCVADFDCAHSQACMNAAQCVPLYEWACLVYRQRKRGSWFDKDE